MPVAARISIAAVCALAACTLAACGSNKSQPREAEVQPRIDLVVGDTLPLTGPARTTGAGAQKAAGLAVQRVNDAIGKANADQVLEIVHEDDNARAADEAARRLLGDGATCIVGPWSRPEMEVVAEAPSVERRALLLSPRAAISGMPGARSGRLVELPPPFPLHPPGGRERAYDAVSDFAQLYKSTDPPTGRPHTADARQFDAVILCYFAALAGASTDSSRMVGALGPATGVRKRFDWTELADAIRALGHGRQIVYLGVSGKYGISPSASGGLTTP